MADQIVHVAVNAGNDKLQDERCEHIVRQIQGRVLQSLFVRIGSVIERDYPRMILGQLSINVTRDGPSAIATIGNDTTMRILSVEKAIENMLVREAYHQAVDESPTTHCWECLEQEPDAADMAMLYALEEELIEEGEFVPRVEHNYASEKMLTLGDESEAFFDRTVYPTANRF